MTSHTTFWRCCSYKSLNCLARVRTKIQRTEKYGVDRDFDDLDQIIEVVCDDHNHKIFTERRKKGELKKLLNKNQEN